MPYSKSGKKEIFLHYPKKQREAVWEQVQRHEKKRSLRMRSTPYGAHIICIALKLDIFLQVSKKS